MLATGFVQQLLAFCAPPAGTDLKIFANGLVDFLSAQPFEFVKTVCSPVHGLPARLKFPLKLADVADAIDAERHRHATIVSNAKWTLHALEKGERERAENERIERERAKITPEERERRMAQILGRMNRVEYASEDKPRKRMTAEEMKADLAAIKARATPERIAEFESEMAEGKAA